MNFSRESGMVSGKMVSDEGKRPDLSPAEVSYLEQMLRVFLAHNRPDRQLIKKYRHWRDKVNESRE